MSQRQELFNFFDFHGTGWISHEDLKQVLGQEFLELKPLFFWVTKVGFRVSFDGKNGGKPSMFFEKRQQEGSVQQGGPKQKGLYTKSNCGESYLFFCRFLLFQYSFTEKNQQVQGYTFRSWRSKSRFFIWESWTSRELMPSWRWNFLCWSCNLR